MSRKFEPNVLPRPTSPYRRWITGFFLILTGLMVADVIPSEHLPLPQFKRALTMLLSRVGLWQGQWSMFAPDPVINNAWLEADLRDREGRQTHWSSPYWAEVDAWGKFRRFREINYFNRLPLDQHRPALSDFADWLRRHAPDPEAIRRVEIQRRELTYLPGPPGTLPTRDNITWAFRTRFLMERSYQP
jgi:hypothetical protein